MTDKPTDSTNFEEYTKGDTNGAAYLQHEKVIEVTDNWTGDTGTSNATEGVSVEWKDDDA